MMTDVIEALVRLAQSQLSKDASTSEDKTLAISCAALFRPWERGVYDVGDIRTYDSMPYECILAHDSLTNPDWDMSVRTLWKPYHSRKKEWALPWIQPTGAHDMYKAGEYMVFVDKNIYKCVSDTSYSPIDYAAAWEVVE